MDQHQQERYSQQEIKKTLGPAARTGYYYLKNPYDDTVSQWWCDMDTDGGGWILVAHTGDGMSDQGTGGTHWWSRSNKGGFDSVGLDTSVEVDIEKNKWWMGR